MLLSEFVSIDTYTHRPFPHRGWEKKTTSSNLSLYLALYQPNPTFKMRSLPSLLPLLSLAAALSPKLTPLHRRDICTDNFREPCDDSCMAPGSVCCNEGTGTYCPAATYCTADGCCPEGEICIGGGGTSTVDVFFGASSTDDVFDSFTSSSEEFFPSSTEDSFASSTDDDFLATSSTRFGGVPSSTEEAFASESTEDVFSSTEESSSARVTRAPRTTSSEEGSAGGNVVAPPTGASAPNPSAGVAAALGVAGLPGLAVVAGQLVLAL